MNPLYLTSPLFWELDPTDKITIPTWEPGTTPLPGKAQVPCFHWYIDWKAGEWQDVVDSRGVQVKVWVHPLKQQHSSGHQIDTGLTIPIPVQGPNLEVPRLPWLRPLPLVRHEEGLWLDFYTTDAFIQEEAIKAMERLSWDFGITMSSFARPLNVFHHSWMEGFPRDADNPFWSHYDPLTHSIQILDDPEVNILDTLHHELGHATLGHRIVQVTTPGGPHEMYVEKHPALAMSEGWAHFVALALRFKPDEVPEKASPVAYKQEDWDKRNVNVPLSPNIEYNVACALWDMYDRPPLLLGRLPEELIALPFAELYRIYNPSLETMPYGPLIPSIDDYVQRLCANHPSQKEPLHRVRDLNCGRSQRVGFQSMNGPFLVVTGRMVTADGATFTEDSSAAFVMEKPMPGEFTHGDFVFVKQRKGLYLSAQGGGVPGSVLLANSTLPQGNEMFVLELAAGTGTLRPGEKMALKHQATNRYVCAGGGGGFGVSVDRATRDIWETFTIAFA